MRKLKKKGINYLMTFLQQNPQIDFKKLNLGNEDGLSNLNWKALKKYKPQILPKLKAYQRLLRIIPSKSKTDLIPILLEDGIESAQQIASIGRKRFESTYLKYFQDNPTIVQYTYRNALAVKNQLLLQIMNRPVSKAIL